MALDWIESDRLAGAFGHGFEAIGPVDRGSETSNVEMRFRQCCPAFGKVRVKSQSGLEHLLPLCDHTLTGGSQGHFTTLKE